MEHMMSKLSENILDKFSMDFLRNQVLKNAYGNDDTIIAGLDPRILLAWYLFFGLVPWFVNDIPFLMGCFLLVMVTTLLARVAGLVLFLFALGVFTQTGYLFLATLLFGGDASAVAPLLILTLKVATISLASVTVFSGLDPDRLSNGLMWYGCPERLSFSISYAYRVLPMLMEEFQNVLLSYRLRGNPPAHETFGGKVKYLIFYLICGVGANAVSLLFEILVGDWSVGAGASGAIFGVVGGLIYVVAVNKGRLEDLSTRQLVTMAAFSLYLGFTSTGVDNTAHVAGLVIGIILAAILYRKPKRTCRADIWGV